MHNRNGCNRFQGEDPPLKPSSLRHEQNPDSGALKISPSQPSTLQTTNITPPRILLEAPPSGFGGRGPAEAVDAPEGALDGDAVLVQREQLPHLEGAQLRERGQGLVRRPGPRARSRRGGGANLIFVKTWRVQIRKIAN